ncbi:MAG TPA: VanZ family protein [Caldimonas sp.]|jgi:VanZ family protein|nr:VanZ family protein [Caldimonas sp.]HEX2540451.1 VanZ family protein [Caldimonas sp.]
MDSRRPAGAQPDSRAAPPRHRSSAVPLAWMYAALIVYASLYPFDAWRNPAVGPLDFLVAPWPRYWTWFDIVSNLFGYLPLGALVFVALVRIGRGTASAVWGTLAAGALLALSMEVLQNYLPRRVPSTLDLGLNVVGAGLGAALGVALHLSGGIAQWQKARERWFVSRSAGGLALLVLWPVALLFPTAVPFGLGHFLTRAQPVIVGILQGTPAEAWTAAWLPAGPVAGGAATPLTPATELSIIVLGLLAPCLVAFTIAARGWRRMVLVVGTVAVGAATTTLSTALNFGPGHAFAWTTPQALQALGVGAIAAALLSLVPRRVAAGIGLMALTALLMLVAQAPDDPYFAQSLQGWEQGRFIRFHGAAQWVGWVWPYAALVYLLARLAAREPRDIATRF